MSIEQKSEILKNQIILAEQTPNEENPLLKEMKSIGIENLPYSYTSLRKFIDPETMNVHYNKHYKGYVKNLNAALKKLGEDDINLEDIIKNISRYNTTIRNNAGGAFNHALFWKMLTPDKQTIHGDILKRIRKDFGSYENFKNKFMNRATTKFGSGWCWLVLTKRNSLKIVCTSNQDNPLMNLVKNGGYPLLGLDIWEHAYYLKYKNKRDEYVQNFWKVVNWEFVNKLYSDQINRNSPNQETKEQIRESRILSEQNSVSPCKSPKFKQVVYSRLSPYQIKLYSKVIFDVLKYKYRENWKESNRDTNTQYGFYDVERPGRSVLNLANTNYSLMCFLVLLMDKVAKEKGWESLNFKTSDQEVFNRNFNRFLGMLKAYKSEITQGWILENVFEILGAKFEKGKLNEDTFFQVLKEKLGDRVQIDVTSGLGATDDFKGIDGRLVIDGKPYTIQVKPFSTVSLNEDNFHVVEGSAAVKNYSTDLMGFISKNRNILVFHRPGMDISKGDYRFPKENKMEL